MKKFYAPYLRLYLDTGDINPFVEIAGNLDETITIFIHPHSRYRVHANTKDFGIPGLLGLFERSPKAADDIYEWVKGEAPHLRVIAVDDAYEEAKKIADEERRNEEARVASSGADGGKI